MPHIFLTPAKKSVSLHRDWNIPVLKRIVDKKNREKLNGFKGSDKK